MRIGKTGIMKTITKIARFLKSLLFHVWHKFPKATQSEINERYNICLFCEYHDKINEQCLACGCNINNKKILMNKLAWADQQCPLNKWTKIER